MKPQCVDQVSQALGRRIDPVEARAIEARLIQALRQDRKSKATWDARSGPERIMAAAERLGRDAAMRTRAARDQIGAPGGQRYKQTRAPVAPWIAESVDGALLREWRDEAQMALAEGAADPMALLAHPAHRAIQAAADLTPTMPKDVDVDAFLAGRRYLIDGQELDAAGYIAHMRARFEAAAGGPVRMERRAVFITGQPGAGKSATNGALARQFGAAAIDLDEMRQGIPEYGAGRKSSLGTQAEAGALRDRLTDQMMQDGANLIIETVGHSPQSLRAAAEEFRARGYSVALANVSVDFARSVPRYALRTMASGRFVDEAYIVQVGDKPRATFAALLEEGGFDGYLQVDANGPQGSEKILHARDFDADAFAAELAAGLDRSRRGDGEGAAGSAGEAGEIEGLAQRLDDGVLQGETFIPEGGVFADPGVIISLFDNADRSTPLHEFGHVFLETLKAYAARPNAPEALLRDLDEIRRWLGKRDDGAFTTAEHEQFARGFEAYLREGNAPSPGLVSAFQAFHKWLADLYRSVRELLGDAELDDGIRGVFDRLLQEPGDVQRVERPISGRQSGPAPGADPGRARPTSRADGGERTGEAGADAGVRGSGASARPGQSPPPPASRISPRILARDPELKAIADDLEQTRAEVEALERQGLLSPAEAAAARADLDGIEKASARPELFRSAAFCLMHGARVNAGAV